MGSDSDRPLETFKCNFKEVYSVLLGEESDDSSYREYDEEDYDDR